MRNIVIGTAGHVDHGKTALVKSLTGINTDTLKEEINRGITVNLGFSYLKLNEELTVGIVDVPGHEKLIKNMLAGVCGIDLILLTVAVDDGIMPQTREHLEIINFLKVKNVIVVLTKTDLVSKDRIEEVKRDILKEFNLNRFVEFSIYKEETTTDVINMITECINTDVEDSENEIFRMPIDRVFNVKGHGVIITGSGISGKVKIGDTLEILPNLKKVRVKGIQAFKQPRDEAYKRMRIALNLGGVKKEEINRGKIITTPETLSPTNIIDVKITVSKSIEDNIKNLEKVKFYYLANEVNARVKLINRKTISAGEVVYGQLLLDEELYAYNKDLGVLRKLNPNITIAGIEIVNTFGQYVNRKDTSYNDLLEVYDNGEIGKLVNIFITRNPFSNVEQIKNGLNLFSKNDKEIIELLDSQKIKFINNIFLDKAYLQKLSNKICEILGEYHKNYPHQTGQNKRELQNKVNLNHLNNRVFNEVLSKIDNIKVINDKIKLASFNVELTDEEQEVASGIIEYINICKFKPPKLQDILKRVNGKNARSIYYSLIKNNQLIKIEEDIVLTKKKYDLMVNLFEKYFFENELLTLNDAREMLDTSRKYIVSYLEYLDKIGYTTRVKEGRIKK